jgi:endonuclease III
LINDFDTLVIKEVIEIIADCACADKNFSEVILPSTLRYIGSEAFYSCDYLKKPILPPSIVSIGHRAFECQNVDLLDNNYVTDGYIDEKGKVCLKKELGYATDDEIEEIVKPCGLGRSKARDINLCMKMLRDEFNYIVPDNMDDLLKLPGVGRKSANLIIGDVYGKPAVVADTHCIRLSNRIGFLKDTTDPYKVEMELKRVVEPTKQNDFCHRLVEHGRAVCTARKAMCENCVLSPYCDYKKALDKKAAKEAAKAEKAAAKKADK